MTKKSRKIERLKRIPVIIRLYEDQVYKSDLMKEARIDRHHLSRELAHQPAKFAFWASLHAKAEERVEALEEQVKRFEAELFIRYSGRRKITEVKFKVQTNQELRILKRKLMKWKNSERELKAAVKTFEQRLWALTGLNANVRKEFEHETRNEGESE